MAPSKKNLKEYYEDGNLDLSLLDLQEVPVREIAAIPKATNLDLSCNAITVLPKTFASSLTHLVKLDLSKNHLTALPDNFGLLVNLKHLDLDSNKVVSLPLSFGNLKALRWLDLKQNPLMPKLAEIAGQCLDAKQCQAAARNVVAALRDMQQQVDAEISRRKEQQQKKAEKEEMAKNQNKENQQPKKKKKKITNAGSQNTDPKHTNGHPHLDKEESINSIKESAYEEKTAPKNKSAQKPGFFRKMGRFLSTVLKWVVMSILLFAFCSFLLSLFDEDLYAATKKKVNDIIQTSVPKQYLKQWNRGLATTRKAAERWSEQFIAISVDCYNKGYDYFVIMSNNEVIQQYLESIKSGWHILWIKVSETAVQIPSYLGSFQNFLYNESSNKTN